MSAGKLTPAKRKWLERALRNPEGEVHSPRPTYDMAGKMQNDGLFEIVDPPGRMPWPFGTAWFLRITEAGRKALEASQ